MTLEELTQMTPSELGEWAKTATEEELQERLLAIRKSRRERMIVKPKIQKVAPVEEEDEEEDDLNMEELKKEKAKKKKEAPLDPEAMKQQLLLQFAEFKKQNGTSTS